MSGPPPRATRSGAPSESIGVIVVAAGESSRMGGIDKIFQPLLGRPLISYTIGALQASPLVVEVVLVLSPDKVPIGRDLAAEADWGKVTSICAGGQRRQDSVRLGLERLAPCGWVAVHDGARPCVTPDLLERGLGEARETGAAVAAVPAKDTIKVVSPDGLVESTPPRDTLWLAQTPQIFRQDLLIEAHRSGGDAFTDDASMVEALGHRVKVFMGSYDNLKVTTPEDLAIVELFLGKRLCGEGAECLPE